MGSGNLLAGEKKSLLKFGEPGHSSSLGFFFFFYSGPTTEDGRECLETCPLPAPREQEALQRGDGEEAQSRDQTGSTTQGCLKSQGPQNIQDPLSLIFIAHFRSKTEKTARPRLTDIKSRQNSATMGSN